MSSRIDVSLDDGTGSAYDRELRRYRSNHPLHTTCKMIVKDAGTVEGNPIVMIVAGDTQIVLTVRNLLESVALIHARHPKMAEAMKPKLPPGSMIEGTHRGVKWQAAHMQNLYVIKTEASQEISLAGEEETARHLAEMMIDRSFPASG